MIDTTTKGPFRRAVRSFEKTVWFVPSRRGTKLRGNFERKSRLDRHRQMGFEREWDFWLDEGLLQLLTRWLKDGGKLFVWHSGLARYPQSYAELVGGRFIFHPERTSVRYFTEDGFSFEIFDEHYFVELRGNVEVFLWSESIFGRSTAGWKKSVGNGKILALTAAHDEEGLKNEKFRQLLEKSLSWLLG